jgi:hypothetical protein
MRLRVPVLLVSVLAVLLAPAASAAGTPEDGPNLLVRGVETLIVLVLLGGIVALVRRRRG